MAVYAWTGVLLGFSRLRCRASERFEVISVLDLPKVDASDACADSWELLVSLGGWSLEAIVKPESHCTRYSRAQQVKGHGFYGSYFCALNLFLPSSEPCLNGL